VGTGGPAGEHAERPGAGPDPGTGAAAAALAELVEVMDRLRSPGGCPWDADQTHESLLPYAVEEVAEVVEAVEAGDRAGLREELGDLLLQVVFHARVAEDHPDDPFGIEDVAAGITAKLRRRHPHVFGDVEAGDLEDLHRRWDALKQLEKPRDSVVDGIPPALPALARAHKVLGRLRRAGLGDAVAEVAAADDRPEVDRAGDLGDRLLRLVVEADGAGVDAEAALRAAVRRLEDAAREAERQRSAGEAPRD
jgi:XTP/dITP diphosphohydrolase